MHTEINIFMKISFAMKIQILKSKKIIDFSETIYESTEFNYSEITKKYYLFVIKSVINELKIKPRQQIDNLRKFIELMLFELFNTPDIQISKRKLGYIEKYLHKYTKLYINSIPSNNIDDQYHFTLFFLFTYCVVILCIQLFTK